jgi:hypothetical protein
VVPHGLGIGGLADADGASVPPGSAVLGWEEWRATATELGIVVAIVTAAIEAGEIASHDPETLAIVLLGALIEAAMLIATAPVAERPLARERSEAVIVDLLVGLRR